MGRFALYLKEDFYKGSSWKSSAFNNDVLSSAPDFVCTSLELWGFDF